MNEEYFKYIYNLSRDDFFNSDGQAYSGRQILFLGDSHGWGEGSPNYQGASSGFNPHIPWIHNKGFFNRVIEYLYKKMDTQPWRCIPFVGKDCNIGPEDIPDNINTGCFAAFIDGDMFTSTPCFLKGRHWICNSAASDYNVSERKLLDVFCNSETRSDSYAVKNYTYNTDIGLLGKGIFVLAPDIDRPCEESYRLTACYGMQNQCGQAQIKICSNKCGGVDDNGVAFIIVKGGLKTLPGWLKEKGQRIYVPELGALSIAGAEQLPAKEDLFIKLSVKRIVNDSDTIDMDIKTLEESIYPGMVIYRSYHGESCVLMDLRTPTRYLVLSLFTNKKYGAKAKIELKSRRSNFTGFNYSDYPDYYGDEAPSVYKTILQDGRISFEPALNVDIEYQNDTKIKYITIDTSDDKNANHEEFYIIDFKQKKKGVMRMSIVGPGGCNTDIHPATDSEVITSRGMLCGNMDLFRNWSMGGHSTGAWLGKEESYWKETRNHIKDAAGYMTHDIKGVVIEAPLVNEWLMQTPIDTFKSRLSEIIETLKCNNVMIFTTLGLKDREFIASNQETTCTNGNSEITFDQYAQAVQEWAGYQSEFKRNNVVFIDCRKYLKNLVYNDILTADDLYINNGHPSPAVNEIISDMLISVIDFIY